MNPILDNRNGVWVLTKGKHEGKSLKHVASEDPGYLRWLWTLESLTDDAFYAVEDAMKESGIPFP